MFLAPLFLLGLAGLAAPVAIHMLQSQRSRHVDFPTIRFLADCQKRASRRSHLKNILLLMMRMLLLALIVVGMAKPWRANEQTIGRPPEAVSIVILLDQSYSMGYVGDELSRFERAKKAAATLIDSLSPGDEAGVILMGESPMVLLEMTTDLAQARQAVIRAPLSIGGSDVEAAMRSAFGMAGEGGRGAASASAFASSSATIENDAKQASRVDSPGSLRRWEIHVLTDMQQHAWTPVVDSDLLRTVDTEALVFLTSFAEPGASNQYVADIVASGAGQTLNIAAEIRASGAGSPENVATLSLDRQEVATTPVSVRPGRPDKAILNGDLGDAASQFVGVSIRGDGLPIDDRRYVLVETTSRSKMLLVDGDPSAAPSLSESYYLAAALNPAMFAPSAKFGVDVVVINADELQSATLDDYQCVILCNLPRLDGSDQVRLEQFIAGGGGVLVFLGDQVAAAEYNAWTFLPASVVGPIGDATKQRAFALGVTDRAHPVAELTAELRAARFFMAIDVNDEAMPEGSRVVARFENDRPAVLERRIEDGRVLMVTTAADLAWSNLPLRRGFVPWVHRLASYLTQEGVTGESFIRGQTVEFRGPASVASRPIAVTTPAGQTVSLAPVIRGDEAVAMFGDTLLPGFYRVDADEAMRHSHGFVVNLDVAESELATVDPAAIVAAAKPGLVRATAAAGSDLVGEITQTRRGDDLWPIVFLLAVVVFVFETLFGNYIARARRGDAAPQQEDALMRGRGARVVE